MMRVPGHAGNEPPASPRLPFRLDPMLVESVRGYLCRLAQTYGAGVNALGELLGLKQLMGLERDDYAKRIAYALRLEAHEWRHLCYKQTGADGQYGPTSFFGQPIGGDRLNYGCPRVCPECLRESAVLWGVWDLALVGVCPIHRCRLVDRCPACERTLRWQRPSMVECYCRFDLRTITAEPAEPGAVAITAIIYRASGFRFDGCETASRIFKYPLELLELQLDPLLRVIAYLGSIQEKSKVYMHHSRFASRSDVAALAASAASALLANWPCSFHELLSVMAPGDIEAPATRSLKDAFGKSHNKLLQMSAKAQIEFLNKAFEDFFIQHWKAPRRGRDCTDSRWVVAAEAGRMIGTRAAKRLVQRGALKGISVKSRTGPQTECWISRESLTRWIAERDGKRSSYMKACEAGQVFGLTRGVVLKLARGRLIRSLDGVKHSLPHGIHLHRDDVMNIKNAFQRSLPLEPKSPTQCELVTLSSAICRLRRTLELGAVLRAIVAGTLVPVAHEKHLPGITGYCFPIELLRNYRRVSEKPS